MNFKNMTIALMIALLYEMLLKLSHIIMPAVFNISPISGTTSVLSFIVGVIIILFLFSFHEEEKQNKRVKLILKLLIVCIVLHLILRVPITERMINFKATRLWGYIIGFIQAVLLFLFLISFKRDIPSGEKSIIQAIAFLTVIFGIGIIKSLYSLIHFARFVALGIMARHATISNPIVFVLFFITHSSIIYFLYRYYQFKFTVK